MGSSPSKQTQQQKATAGVIRKTASSTSFGRLAIGSPASVSHTPGSGRSSQSLAHRRRMRAQLDHAASYQNLLSSNNIDGIGGGETTPLIQAYATTATTTTTSSGYSTLLPPPQRLLSTGSSGGGDDFASTAPPPLAVWIVPALCCAMAYALYNIFIKKGSASINPVLGGVILQLVAAMLGMVLLLVLISREGTDEVLIYDAAGIRWAILAGVSVGVAEIVSFFVSSLGVQAMQSIPIIIGGSVMFGTTIGAIFLKEELSYRGWIGVVMISCGISLVGDDTGEGV
ncbi:EamA-like transporter family protein [Nitzschia inconspicua]|uniref:EamA-like transporter family protein n=1 Tax=Nitzschia inconspicua TaxID=303405 RepID=A0A9K3KB21_9STRA|nr:EamA-like transporter family protein [Nitzschia inconspicua]KAG7365615.1 EamA-like transporter family protein [Nitzschia inconspicua]